MSDVKAFKALSLLVTIGVLVVGACTIQFRGGEEAYPKPTASQTTDATSSELARCRSVTSKEAAPYQHCQGVWAENRRRFFGKNSGSSRSSQDDTAAGLMPASKDQSRVPQGYLILTTPDASKP